MTIQILINSAIKDAEAKPHGGCAVEMTDQGKIICAVKMAYSRTQPKGWWTKRFYIVKPGEKYRSNFSLAKAQIILGE